MTAVRPVGPGAATGLATAWLRDGEAFASVAEDWDALHAEAIETTPFQRSGWLLPWWSCYGRGSLAVLTVRSSGRLVGGAALFRHRRAGVRVLSPVGHPLSDVHAFLARASHEADVVQAIAAALLREAGWDVLDLPELRAGGLSHRLATGWPGALQRVPSSVCLELVARPVEGLLASLPTRTRHTIQRKLRIIDRAGVTVRSVPPAQVAEAVTTLLELHELQWRGRGGNPEHLTPRFAALLREATSRLAAVGCARVEQYLVNGRVHASELLLVDDTTVGAYLTGVDPALREMLDSATLTMRHNLAVTLELGRERYSMLRGREDYKMRWRPERVQQDRVVLVRPGSIAGRAYAAAVRGEVKARRWLADEHPRLRGALEAVVRSTRQDGLIAGVRTLLAGRTKR